MRQLSELYGQEYDKPIMGQLRCKISWGVVNTDAQQGNTPSSTDLAPFANISVPVLNNAMTPESQYGTFEPFLFDLTGSMALIPESGDYGEIGYISNSICGADGVFANPPVLHFEFDNVINLYGILLNFSFYLREYPVEFDVIGTKPDTSTVANNITNNADYSLPISLNFEGINKLDIVIKKWCRGIRRARLVELEFHQRTTLLCSASLFLYEVV